MLKNEQDWNALREIKVTSSGRVSMTVRASFSSMYTQFMKRGLHFEAEQKALNLLRRRVFAI